VIGEGNRGQADLDRAHARLTHRPVRRVSRPLSVHMLVSGQHQAILSPGNGGCRRVIQLEHAHLVHAGQAVGAGIDPAPGMSTCPAWPSSRSTTWSITGAGGAASSAFWSAVLLGCPDIASPRKRMSVHWFWLS
jgi:hypothetical protein